jgi:hypothetical protein
MGLYALSSYFKKARITSMERALPFYKSIQNIHPKHYGLSIVHLVICPKLEKVFDLLVTISKPIPFLGWGEVKYSHLPST